MRTPINTLATCLFVAAVASQACGGERGSASAVTVDTLANGAVRSISHVATAPGTLALERLLDIQPPADDSTELINPRSIAVAHDGSVLVSESGAGHIKVFAADGSFRRSIGRRGQGPNEYEVAYLAVVGDTLLIQDPNLTRLSRVAWRSGEYLGSVHTGCCYWSPFGVDGAGRAWVYNILQAPDSTLGRGQGYFRVGASGAAIDTVFAYERRGLPEAPYWVLKMGRAEMQLAVPLQPRVHFEVDPTGTLLTGWSGEYSIRETSDGRDTVSLFGRDWAPTPVTRDDKQRLVDARIAAQLSEGAGQGPDEATYRNAFDPSLIPDRQPAYTALSVDGTGRRWLQVSTGDTTQVRFDVFSRDGRWLDSVSLPADAWPREDAWAAWGLDRVAVRLEDAEGRPLIRVFAIRSR